MPAQRSLCIHALRAGELQLEDLEHAVARIHKKPPLRIGHDARTGRSRRRQLCLFRFPKLDDFALTKRKRARPWVHTPHTVVCLLHAAGKIHMPIFFLQYRAFGRKRRILRCARKRAGLKGIDGVKATQLRSRVSAKSVAEVHGIIFPNFEF